MHFHFLYNVFFAAVFQRKLHDATFATKLQESVATFPASDLAAAFVAVLQQILQNCSKINSVIGNENPFPFLFSNFKRQPNNPMIKAFLFRVEN